MSDNQGGGLSISLTMERKNEKQYKQICLELSLNFSGINQKLAVISGLISFLLLVFILLLYLVRSGLTSNF
jgi:hypothetical protein